MRKIQFKNGEYYHIYNRGVEKRTIFLDENDYKKFLRSLSDFNNSSYYEERLRIFKEQKELSYFLSGLDKVVEIVAYSLISNHFHLILKQVIDNGISNFMHKLGTSFTNYFNIKYDRSGSLFQGPYKAVHIENDQYLLWLSGYVNGNIEIHEAGSTDLYHWSSLQSFITGQPNAILGDIDIIVSQFKNTDRYRKFVKKVIKESQNKKQLKRYFLEHLT